MHGDPTSDSWGGQNVFDVFTKAQGRDWTVQNTRRAKSGFRRLCTSKQTILLTTGHEEASVSSEPEVGLMYFAPAGAELVSYSADRNSQHLRGKR